MIIQGKRDFLVKKAASFLAVASRIFASVKDQVVIGVANGDGVPEILAELADLELPWARVHVFVLEEGLDPAQAPQGTGNQLCKWLCHRLEPDQLHLFPRYSGDEAKGVASYLDEFNRLGGVLDLVLVSCGEDGHIASLYPNHPLMEKRRDGFVIIDDAPEPPYRRMSATANLILRADTGVLLALGDSRKGALVKFFDVYLSEVECPAKLFARLNRYYLMTDQNVKIP